jgi:DNA-binding MarR family transcriptional regulator
MMFIKSFLQFIYYISHINGIKMNKTIELVNEWAVFDENHPNEGLDAFCRYYLISQREKQSSNKFLEGIVPSKKSSMLTKLLVKIVRIHNVYLDMATKGIGIKQAEEFYFLSVIKNLKSPRKTEVIYHTVNELSNGLNILNSLIKQGYITEENDADDKRSKRVSITPRGDKILLVCYEKIQMVSELMFLELPDDDILLCIQLLKNVELKFSGQWLQHKSKPFGEVYESVTGKKVPAGKKK